MAATGFVLGISAGSAQTNNELAAMLVELRMLNQNIVAIGAGQVLTDDPNVYRLDALANGYYTSPPVVPVAGQG